MSRIMRTRGQRRRNPSPLLELNVEETGEQARLQTTPRGTGSKRARGRGRSRVRGRTRLSGRMSANRSGGESDSRPIINQVRARRIADSGPHAVFREREEQRNDLENGDWVRRHRSLSPRVMARTQQRTTRSRVKEVRPEFNNDLISDGSVQTVESDNSLRNDTFSSGVSEARSRSSYEFRSRRPAPNTMYTTLIAHQIDPPKFNGKLSEARGWVTRFMRVAKGNQWSDEVTLYHIRESLESAAAQWYDGKYNTVGGYPKSWSQFYRHFSKRYSLDDSDEYIVEQLRRTTQDPGEGLAEFTDRMENLFGQMRSRLSDKQKLNMIRRGSLKKFAPILAMCWRMKDLERLKHTADDTYLYLESNNREKEVKADITGSSSKTQTEIMKGLNGNSKEQFNNRVCYNCLKTGHTSERCFQEKDLQRINENKKRIIEEQRVAYNKAIGGDTNATQAKTVQLENQNDMISNRDAVFYTRMALIEDETQDWCDVMELWVPHVNRELALDGQSGNAEPQTGNMEGEPTVVTQEKIEQPADMKLYIHGVDPYYDPKEFKIFEIMDARQVYQTGEEQAFKRFEERSTNVIVRRPIMLVLLFMSTIGSYDPAESHVMDKIKLIGTSYYKQCSDLTLNSRFDQKTLVYCIWNYRSWVSVQTKGFGMKSNEEYDAISIAIYDPKIAQLKFIEQNIPIEQHLDKKIVMNRETHTYDHRTMSWNKTLVPTNIGMFGFLNAWVLVNEFAYSSSSHASTQVTVQTLGVTENTELFRSTEPWIEEIRMQRETMKGKLEIIRKETDASGIYIVFQIGELVLVADPYMNMEAGGKLNERYRKRLIKRRVSETNYLLGNILEKDPIEVTGNKNGSDPVYECMDDVEDELERPETDPRLRPRKNKKIDASRDP